MITITGEPPRVTEDGILAQRCGTKPHVPIGGATDVFVEWANAVKETAAQHNLGGIDPVRI